MDSTRGFPRAAASSSPSEAVPEPSMSIPEYLYHHILTHNLPTPILFVFVACSTGVMIRTLLKNLNIPPTALLALLGLITGSLALRFEQVKAITGIMGAIGPVLLMHVFFPILLFTPAFAMDPQVFQKSAGQVFLLSLPGFLMSTSLTGLLAAKVFEYKWDWYTSMMFATIATATDPILSSASIKHIAASHISVLVEAESLFNDSTCDIVFEIFLDLIRESHTDKAGLEIAVKLILKFVASPMFGFVISKIITFWLSCVVNDEMTEVGISFVMVYITFYIAEWVGLSGVIAVTTLGLLLDIVSFSPGTDIFLLRFWELLSFLANTLIFTIAGVVIAEHTFIYMEPMDLFYICVLYLGLFIIRLIVILLLSPFLKRIGYGFNWRTGIVVVWSGMRGAFSLNMALVAFQTDNIGSMYFKSKLLLLIAGTTLLNLIVNATSVKKIISLLGFNDISTAKRMAMYSIVHRLRQSASITVSMLKMDRFVADAAWDLVEDEILIKDPYYTSEHNVTLEELFPELITAECPDCLKSVPPEPTPRDIADMLDEAKLRMLKAQVISYWKQYNSGMLNRETTRILINATESYGGQKGKFMNIHEVKKCWEAKGILVFVRQKMKNWVYNIKEEKIKPSQNKALKICYNIIHTEEFEFIIYMVILLNNFPIGLYLVEKMIGMYEEELLILNYFFISLYILEVFVKVLAMRKYYIFDHWNQFDVCILVIGIIELASDWAIEHFQLRSLVLLIRIVETLRFLRLLRVLHLLKVLLPGFIKLLDKQIDKQLRSSYDIAKGFVIGEEDVKSVVDQISDNKNISQKLKIVVEKYRQDAMHELGLLQHDYPEVVIAAKTSQAIRTVLNNIKETLHGLLAVGIIDHIEGAKLNKIILSKIQQLNTFATTIPTPSAEELLLNVPWLENAKKQTAFIKRKAKIVFFNYGDTICKENEPPQGIHIIVSGLVKLHGSNPLFGHKTNDQEESASTAKIPFTDYRGSGTILSEVNCLTKQAMEVTIVCETAVQTCFIEVNDLFEAFDAFLEFPSLEYKVWLAVAIRIAMSTFKENVAYQSWTSSKIYSWLSKAFVEHLEMNRKFDVYDGSMEDVILVYGSLKDCHLLVPYYAPCIVPKNSHQVQGTGNTTKLLIVPSVDNPNKRNIASGNVMKCSSALCLHHAAARRKERTRQTSISIAVSDSQKVLQANESYIRGKTEEGGIAFSSV